MPSSKRSNKHKFFPSNLHLSAHPMIYDIILILTLLTLFTLPIYLAFPSILTSLLEFINSASRALVWLFLSVIGISLVIVGILSWEMLISKFNQMMRKGIKDKVVVLVDQSQSEEMKSTVGIGADPKIKKAWKDKVLSELNLKNRKNNNGLEDNDDSEGIEMSVLDNSSVRLLRKRKIPPPLPSR